MTFQETKKLITTIIREEFKSRGLDIKQMVLFGSQARGNASPDSDWDFLVSIDKDLEFGEKGKLTTAIQRRLAIKHISADIIIKSEKKIKQERDNVGVVTYYALKYGVIL